jgi:hypothetical protein
MGGSLEVAMGGSESDRLLLISDRCSLKMIVVLFRSGLWAAL